MPILNLPHQSNQSFFKKATSHVLNLQWLLTADLYSQVDFLSLHFLIRVKFLDVFGNRLVYEFVLVNIPNHSRTTVAQIFDLAKNIDSWLSVQPIQQIENGTKRAAACRAIAVKQNNLLGYDEFGPASNWSSGYTFVFGTGGLRFKSEAGHIGHGVFNGSAPLWHFERCYVQAQWRGDGALLTRNMLRRSTASIMKDFDLNFEQGQRTSVNLIKVLILLPQLVNYKLRIFERVAIFSKTITRLTKLWNESV